MTKKVNDNKLWKIIDKEFISYYGGYACLISNGDCKFHVWEKKEDAQKVCDRLNELYEENHQLKRQIGNLEHTRDFCAECCERLEKENEQLKSENNLLRTNVGKLTDDVKYLQNLPSTHQKENNQLKSRINDLEWILGIRSDITPVYWGDRNFNCCILDLMGNGRQKSVLNYLYDHYRKNDYEIKDFDNILREHGVKYGKYGWEKER